MKTKSTLFFLGILLLLPFIARSQAVDDTIRTLIITEAHGGPMFNAYVELTNVGDEAVNLMDFEFGSFTNSTSPAYQAPFFWYKKGLADVMLPPGETFVISNINHLADNYPEFNNPLTVRGRREVTDLEVHWDEPTPGDNEGRDSISYDFWRMLTQWNGNFCMYLEYHVGGDSAIVDAVFNNIAENNHLDANPEFKAVAGIPDAWGTHILVRKSTVTSGNTVWNDARGTSLENSEWLPIPYRDPDSPLRRYFTTIGHHGVAHVDLDFVGSSNVTIDMDNQVMTVPFGIYRDSIMDEFDLEQGIAWHMHLSPSVKDSASNIVVTGDTLTLYAVGETLEQKDFRLEQAAPSDDMALVFPLNMIIKAEEGDDYFFPTPFYVTEDMPEIDSIGDIDFATRVDTLFKYIQKAPDATWEIVWVDGTERVDLKRGDILRLTAKDGSQKDYYLSVDSIPDLNDNAYLSAITWPDVPGFLSQSPQWNTDTIPGFRSMNFSYKVMVPYGTKSIPAIKAIPEDQNAELTIERATRIDGTVSDRTTKITVTSENDSVVNIYTVLFEVEKPQNLIQPFAPGPIISRITYRQFHVNNFFEVFNPGNQPLDMSNYMLARGNAGMTPVEIIERGVGVYAQRYQRYIPGYDYQSEIEWGVNPDIIEKDLQLNPVINPGECLVMSETWQANHSQNIHNEDCDVIFTWHEEYLEDRETYGTEDSRVFLVPRFGRQARFTGMNSPNESLLLFEITNDSIKQGLKGVGDPADYKLIDMFGTYDGSFWSPGEDELTTKFYRIERKPEFWQGNPLPGVNGSWADTDEESEWTVVTRGEYMNDMGYGGWESMVMIGEGLGVHSINPVQVYKSTVTSYVYKVSDGYQSPQNIDGVMTNTTVSNFVADINWEDPGQTYEVIGVAGIKEGDDLIMDLDTLKVTSADGENETKYVLAVSDEGLDSDAVLVAANGSGYTIEYEGSEGSIAGIEYGATLREVKNNVIVPQSAILNIIDNNANLVPMHMRNFDTVYVETLASQNIFFEVLAEDGVTKITYQLKMDSETDDALLFSNVYNVDQDLKLITLIPSETRVKTLFNNSWTNEGASIKLVDKSGMERTQGFVAFDDRVVVTSPNGAVQEFYYLTFLEELEGTEAYLLSDLFVIDQNEYIITEVPQNLSYNVFVSLLTVAPGADFVVLDEEDFVIESGIITDGHTVKVTSGDGNTVVTYNVSLIVSSKASYSTDISVYPNPATDQLHVKGLYLNGTLQITNIVGVTMKVIEIRNTQSAVISINDLPAGIYFINMKKGSMFSKPVRFMKQ